MTFLLVHKSHLCKESTDSWLDVGSFLTTDPVTQRLVSDLYQLVCMWLLEVAGSCEGGEKKIACTFWDGEAQALQHGLRCRQLGVYQGLQVTAATCKQPKQLPLGTSNNHSQPANTYFPDGWISINQDLAQKLISSRELQKVWIRRVNTVNIDSLHKEITEIFNWKGQSQSAN